MAHSRFDSVALGQLAMKALTDPGLLHMSVTLLGQWTDHLVYICMVMAEVQGDKDSMTFHAQHMSREHLKVQRREGSVTSLLPGSTGIQKYTPHARETGKGFKIRKQYHKIYHTHCAGHIGALPSSHPFLFSVI